MTPPFRFCTIVRLGTVLALAAGCTARAAAPPAPSTAASAASAAASGAQLPVLTQAQLRECLSRRDRMRTDADGIAAEKTQLDKDRAALQSTIAELQTRADKIDRKNKDEIDAYNADSTEGNRQIATMDARIKAFNTRVEGLSDAQDAYETECVNKAYDPRDAVPDKPH